MSRCGIEVTNERAEGQDEIDRLLSAAKVAKDSGDEAEEQRCLDEASRVRAERGGFIIYGNTVSMEIRW